MLFLFRLVPDIRRRIVMGLVMRTKGANMWIAKVQDVSAMLKVDWSWNQCFLKLKNYKVFVMSVDACIRKIFQIMRLSLCLRVRLR